MSRTVILIADGCGIGGAPDARAWHSTGANTLAHTAAAVGGLTLPTLGRWGLGCLTTLTGVPPADEPAAIIARAVQHSAGCDTPSGHWELFGHISPTAPPTFPDGFDPTILAQLADLWGVPRVLGGENISGLAVLDLHGAEAADEGLPIVYTSADSVLQVAAHTGAVPLDKLYRWCGQARTWADEMGIGRVIARPFTGTPGAWKRQSGQRRDWSTTPPHTAIDDLAAAGVPVVGIGKTGDIFGHRGLVAEAHPDDLDAALAATAQAAIEHHNGVIVTNLAEFDYRGHARDPQGFAAALERLDDALGDLEANLQTGDRIVVSADHGCDPTFRVDDRGQPTVNHTRERVPLLIATVGRSGGCDLGELPMSCFGSILCHWYGIGPDDSHP